ncbi:MAG: OstA-like protein [Bacteroidota bacterium]
MPVQAQEETETRLVQIVNADSVAGVIEDGQRIRRLIGNVVLRQEETRLRAQRATQFLDFDVTVFEGDVRIIEEGDTLTARLVRYNSVSKTGEAEGDVRIADSTAVLFAPSATYDSRAKTSYFTAGARLVEDDATLTSRRGTYNSRTKLATFTDDVRLTDSTTVLTSRRGTYNTETRRADFAGDVRLEHPDTYLEADSLVHFRETQRSEAHGRVFIERFGDEEPGDAEPEDAEPGDVEQDDAEPDDDEQDDTEPGTGEQDDAEPDDEEVDGLRNAAPALPDSLGATAARDSTLRTLLFGDRALHDERRGFSRIDGQPLLVTLRTDSTGATDTLLVRARILEAYRLDPATLDSMETAEAEKQRAAVRGAAADSAAVDTVAADSVAVPSDAVPGVAVDSTAVDGAAGRPAEERAALRGEDVEEDSGSEAPLERALPEDNTEPPGLRDDAEGEQGRGPPPLRPGEVDIDALRTRYGDDGQAVPDSLPVPAPDPPLEPPGPQPTTYDLRPGTEITRLIARDSVRIVQPDLVAVADSAVLDRFAIPPPEATPPEAIPSETVPPETMPPGTMRPDSLMADALAPDVPTADTLTTDSLTTDSLTTDSLLTDSLTTGLPTTGSPTTGSPTTGSPTTGAPTTDPQGTDGPGLGVQPQPVGAPASRASENRDVLRLFVRPSVWVDETQVTGAAMTVLASAETLDTLRVDGQAFAAQRDTSLARVNQIRGRTMLALFDEEVQPDSTRENTLRQLLVWPNAEAIYFRAKAQEDDAPPLPPDSLLDGAVQVSADSIAFTFARDTLRAVRGYRGIEGLSYAADIVPAALRLGGYVYTPERRPTQRGLLRPGSREAVRLGLSDSLAAPVFDIPDVDAARDSVGARLDSLDAERLRLDSLRTAPVELRPPPGEVPTVREEQAPPPRDPEGERREAASRAVPTGSNGRQRRRARPVSEPRPPRHAVGS